MYYSADLWRVAGYFMGLSVGGSLTALAQLRIEQQYLH
jgi:hypothetical protein